MNLQLEGKTILVTAASKGLGKAIALKLSAEGANIAICSRDLEQLEKTAQEIRSETGGEVLAIKADVTVKADIVNFVEQALTEFGGIYGLVCNAGGPTAGTFMSITDEDWENAIQLNMMSVIRLIREVIAPMKQGGEGRIINLASSSIKQPIPGLVLSNTIRLGVQGLIKTLSEELAPDILVNTVSPGRFDTDRVRGLDAGRAIRAGITTEQFRTGAEQEIAVGRYGDAEEFARYVAFMVSPLNSYMTGQMLLIDGGLTKSI
jgi:3-oxoacyl-[acyl-carrier protein] reductase